jgi:hypothetical protein
MPSLNKQLVKTLYRIGRTEAEENYRLYLIAREHFAGRSGIFSLSELMDVLHTHHGHKTLHHGPGNNRTRTRRRLTAQLGASILFETLQDGRYKARSERRVYQGRATKINAPGAILNSRRAFCDALAGVLGAGNQLKSYKKLSKQTGRTEKAVYMSMRRLQAAGHIEKTNNFIITDVKGTLKQINGKRAMLCRYHGIATPAPIEYGGEYYLALYAANSYKWLDGRRVKGTDRLKHYVKKADFWLRRAHYTLERRVDGFLWEFNPRVYSLNDYIGAYGFAHV